MRVQLVSAFAFVLSIALGVCLSSRGASERVLAAAELAEAFGGSTGQGCCIVINACKGDQYKTCAAYDGNSGSCTGSVLKAKYNTQYAKHCQSNSCSACSCTDYHEDADGKKYSCIDFYSCTYSLGFCQDGAITGQTDGASCADNCPA